MAGIGGGGGVAQDESGGWGYHTGTSGTVVVTGRIVCVACTSPSATPATVLFNAGSPIGVAAGGAFAVNPRGLLANATIVFDSTSSYFVEYLA